MNYKRYILGLTMAAIISSAFGPSGILGSLKEGRIGNEVFAQSPFSQEYIGQIEVLNGIGQSYSFDASKVFKFLPNPYGGDMLLQMDEIVFSRELSKMADVLSVKAVDASTKININGERTSLTESVLGIDMDKELVKQEIIMRVRNRDYTPYTAAFRFGDPPRRTTDEMKKINFVLSEFSTRFDSDVRGRSTNTSLAASSIDGIILMPGEEFSFNRTLGPITTARGYQNAPVIVSGEFVEGIGGGICQVSTTLFNSVLRAGLQITDRRPHSLPVAYVPRGTDAMVSSSSDFKFKNNFNNPIYIQAYVQNSRIHFKIYGSQNDSKNVDISVRNIGERRYQLTRTIDGRTDNFYSTYREPNM